MRNLFSAIGIVLLMTSCADLLPKFIPPQPRQIQNTFPVDKPFDSVWQAVIEAFAELNLPIDNLERDSGLITTDWINFQEQNPENGYCDCGKVLIPQSSSPDWIMGRPIKEEDVTAKTYTTFKVRGRFNVFVKESEQGPCEIKINSIFETDFDTEQKSCLSTGRLEASLYKIIQKKLG